MTCPRKLTPEMAKLLKEMQQGALARRGWNTEVERLEYAPTDSLRWGSVRRPTLQGLIDRKLVVWDGVRSAEPWSGLASYYRAVRTEGGAT